MKFLLLFFSLFLTHYCLPFSKNPSTGVETINERTFQERVFGGTHIWLIAFVKTGQKESEEIQDTWETVAVKVFGMLKVGAVDVDSPFGRQIIKDMGQQKLPLILLFPPAQLSDPKQYGGMPYTGAMKAESIASWGLRQLPNLAASLTTNKKTKEFLESPHYPKVILFTNKPTTSALYKGLALEFLGRLHFAEIRNQPEIEKQFGVTGFPTLIIIKDKESNAIKYEGTAFKWNPIFTFLNQHAPTKDEAIQKQKKIEEERKLKEELAKKEQEDRKKEELALIVNPTVRVHTTAMWNKLLDGGLTLLAVLDTSSESHKNYLRTLKEVWKKSQKGGTKYNFAWIDGPQQLPISTYFGVDGQYPAVVFMNGKKDWWKLMVGSFSTEGIYKYASAMLLKGAGKPLKNEKLPAFQTETNPNGLSELDGEEEKAYELKKEEEKKKPAKPTKPVEAKEEKKPKKPANEKPKKDDKKPAKKTKSAEEVERRNKERDEKKRLEREAMAAERQKAMEEREAKIKAEKEAKEKKKLKKKKKAEKASTTSTSKTSSKTNTKAKAEEKPSKTKTKTKSAADRYFEAMSQQDEL